MRWFRSHLRLGSRLALFALAVQIVLSFGHVHLDKRAFWSASVATASVDIASRDRAPAPLGRHTGADDFCAICATVSLIASSVLPESSLLGLPVATEYRWPNEFANASFASHSSVLFQARAPPTVL